jgi:hypothetical protein
MVVKGFLCLGGNMRGSPCRQRLEFLAAMLFLLVCTTLLNAQVDSASIVGTINDPSGAVIHGAKVTVTNAATGETQTVVVGDSGTYVFPYLRVGTYSVSSRRQVSSRPSAPGSL